jgi:hypothetical protein
VLCEFERPANRPTDASFALIRRLVNARHVMEANLIYTRNTTPAIDGS